MILWTWTASKLVSDGHMHWFCWFEDDWDSLERNASGVKLSSVRILIFIFEKWDFAPILGLKSWFLGPMALRKHSKQRFHVASVTPVAINTPIWRFPTFQNGFLSKIAFFLYFPIHFNTKYGKNKRTVFRPPSTPFQELKIGMEISFSIPRKYAKDGEGCISWTLKWHDSQACASDRIAT